MPLALEMQGIYARYGDMPALFGVDIAVPTGSVAALLGPNGAGKTTLLRVAMGILAPTAGRIRFHGEDVTRSGVRPLARRGLCMIPEGRGIFPTLTVRDNVVLHTHLKGRAATEQILHQTFDRFPILGNRCNQVAGTLSGGEQQMLALSRALTTEPSVVLLDEISMGLAPLVIENLFDVVRQLANEGKTILLVEQLVQNALALSDYVYVLQQGRIRAVGEPGDVREIIVDSYLGEAGHEEAGASPSSTSLSEAGGGDRTPDHGSRRAGQAASASELVATNDGTMAHLPTCPIAVSARFIRPVSPDERPRTCGLCEARAGSTSSAAGASAVSP